VRSCWALGAFVPGLRCVRAAGAAQP